VVSYSDLEPVFLVRPGRPRVAEEQKREKARLRQKAYRERIHTLIQEARKNRGLHKVDMVTRKTEVALRTETEKSVAGQALGGGWRLISALALRGIK